LGWTLYLASIIFTILSLVGVFEYTEFFSVRLLWLGVALEKVVFSFALVERMNLVRRSLEEEHRYRIIAEKELEIEGIRAAEAEVHSQELMRQNDIVSRQAASIQQANVLLMEQNKHLEDLNHEKNEILAIVSHDMKNPLSALRGIIELLQNAGLEASVSKSALLQMQLTIDKMLAMVKNLLDVNRIETGELAYSFVGVDAGTLLYSSIAHFQKSADLKGIHILSHNIAASLPRIWVDEQALTQVADNLLSNAIKYSPYRSSIFISAFFYNADDANYTVLQEHRLKQYDMLLPQCVVIAFQDQGPGISKQDQKRLFGKFVRLSAQPTGGEHSTGLGLSIVKKLVEAMHGRVWCESDFGYGATFFVALPLATATPTNTPS
jgi:signal transduction histidine kinase